MKEISACDFMNSEIADKIDIISKKDLQRLVTFFSTASFDEIMMVLKAAIDKETPRNRCGGGIDSALRNKGRWTKVDAYTVR